MKYLKIWYYFFKENLYYWNSILARSIFLILLCVLITTLVWMWVNFEKNAIIWWIEYQNYIWYIWVSELVVMWALSKKFFNEIISWEVVNYLTRPIKFLYFFWWKILGSKLVMSFVLWIFSFPIILIINHFQLPHTHPIIFLIIFLIWISISVLIDTIVFLFSFWVENAMFLRLIFQKVYFILWWLFFPLAIYPTWLKNIWETLPFQYAIQLPAKFFVNWKMNFLLEKNWIFILFAWFVILIWINFLLYQKIIKKLEINGG